MTDEITPLTEEEIVRFRRKIGDRTEAFDEEVIQDLYVEAVGSFSLAVHLAYEELLGNAYLFTDYTQNETQEKKSQIFSQIKVMSDRWKKKADDEHAAANSTAGTAQFFELGWDSYSTEIE